MLVRAVIIKALQAALFAPLAGLVLMHNPAVAYADEDTFLSDMEAAGLHNSDGNGAEIAVGHEVCGRVAAGAAPAQVAEFLWHNSQMTEQASVAFVEISIRDLCPDVLPGGSGTNT